MGKNDRIPLTDAIAKMFTYSIIQIHKNQPYIKKPEQFTHEIQWTNTIKY